MLHASSTMTLRRRNTWPCFSFRTTQCLLLRSLSQHPTSANTFRLPVPKLRVRQTWNSAWTAVFCWEQLVSIHQTGFWRQRAKQGTKTARTSKLRKKSAKATSVSIWGSSKIRERAWLIRQLVFFGHLTPAVEELRYQHTYVRPKFAEWYF